MRVRRRRSGPFPGGSRADASEFSVVCLSSPGFKDRTDGSASGIRDVHDPKSGLVCSVVLVSALGTG